MDLKILAEIPPWEWPRDTDKRFLEILGDAQADEDDRSIAVELAGDFTVINDELAQALLTILQSDDEPEELRGSAAISLGPVIDYAYIEEFEDPEEDPITEDMFLTIQETLHRLYQDNAVPKLVRRRILEASVHAPQDWHKDAIQAAYSSDDEDWILTAVFAMRWFRGFEDQILEALESGNQEIHCEAVRAAGNWEVEEAWSHISGLISQETDKSLLLAAIDAVISIHPEEAGMLLVDLTDSDDEEIVEAAEEAMAMADGLSGDLLDDDDEYRY